MCYAFSIILTLCYAFCIPILHNYKHMKIDTSYVDSCQDIHELIGNKSQDSSFECDFHLDEGKSAFVKDNKYCCSSCDCELTSTLYYSQRNNLQISDALVYLSAKNKVPQNPLTAKVFIRQNILKRINSEIANMCHKELYETGQNNKVCLDYIKNERAISDETINRYKLGYFPSTKKFTDSIITKYGIDPLMELGIVQESKEYEGYYSPFKNRLIFPIENSIGKTIGFGGRDLTGKSNIKYTNSKASVIFKKNKTLYSSTNSASTAVVVEGYMDVVSCSQESSNLSFHASLGVAISTNQIRQLLLQPNIDQVVICLDNDPAGLSAMKSMIQKNINKIDSNKIKFALLDNKMDPDDFIKKYGVNDFIEKINSAFTAAELVTKTHESALPSPDKNLRLMEELDLYNIQPT
jgi:DNA primase